MSSSMILNESLIISGRDIPLKELLYAKRVLDNYMAVAKESSPLELLTEMKSAAKQVRHRLIYSCANIKSTIKRTR